MKKTFVFVMIALLCGRFSLAQETAGQTSAPNAVSAIQEVQPEIEDVFVPTTAVLPFEARGRQAESSKAGWNISELLFINLLESGSIDMVERPELEKALDELHLSAVGMTSPDTQMKLGQLVGAKILITGSLFETGKKKYVVAKIIGTMIYLPNRINNSVKYESISIPFGVFKGSTKAAKTPRPIPIKYLIQTFILRL